MTMLTSYLTTLFLTVAVEVNVFLYFRIRGKMLILLIVLSNVMTNLLLHIGLSVFHHVILLEILVVLAEILIYQAVFYCSIRKTVIYAVSANLLSYMIGVYLFM